MGWWGGWMGGVRDRGSGWAGQVGTKLAHLRRAPAACRAGGMEGSRPAPCRRTPDGQHHRLAGAVDGHVVAGPGRGREGAARRHGEWAHCEGIVRLGSSGSCCRCCRCASSCCRPRGWFAHIALAALPSHLPSAHRYGLLRHSASSRSCRLARPVSAATASLLASGEAPPTASKLGGTWKGVEDARVGEMGWVGCVAARLDRCRRPRQDAWAPASQEAPPGSRQRLHRLQADVAGHVAHEAGGQGEAIGCPCMHGSAQQVLQWIWWQRGEQLGCCCAD